MTDITLSPSALSGTVTVPPSKSDVHRAIICASLAKGKSVISPIELSKDINATIGCAKALGAEISLEGKTLTIDGSAMFSGKSARLDCCESGSTLRFSSRLPPWAELKPSLQARGCFRKDLSGCIWTAYLKME